MAEEIQIGADASDAINELGKIANAFQSIAKDAGASDKAVNAAMRNMERSIGGVVADLGKAQTAFARFGAGGITGAGGANGLQLRKGVTQGMQAARKETDAYARSLTGLLSIQERELAQAKAAKSAGIRGGIGLNSAGRMIEQRSGRFLSGEAFGNYQAQLGYAEKLVNAEQQYASKKALTNKQLSIESGLANKFHGVQDDLNRQRERGIRQQQLETAFASKFYGLADQNAGVLRRTANLMGQIPPATWGRSLQRAGSAVMNMSNSTRYAMYDVANSTGVAGTAILGLGALAIGAATSHERAFANVRRTTQTTELGYRSLQRSLEEMSMSLPITFEELAGIASAAGQLGIEARGVAAFTEVVAKLTATTNLTADAAGVALARFKAFFAESDTAGLEVTEATFTNLASSILRVGVNSIATESGIVNVAVQIASMADYAGYTANQVIGLAGALASIGVAPELSRGTITRTFSLIGTAVSTGGDRLEAFARLAGISASEFKAAWGTENFAGVFTNMIKGLHNVTKGGQDANLMLMEMGFNSVRDRPLLLRLAGAANELGEAGGLLAASMDDAAKGWVENSELALQYEKISKTTSARLQVLGQTFEQLFATMATDPNSIVGDWASFITDFVRGIERMSQTDFGRSFGGIVTTAALIAGGLLLIISLGARTTASLQGIGVAWTAMTNTGLSSLKRLSMAWKLASLSMGLIGLIGSIAALAVGFIGVNQASQEATRAIQDTSGLVSAMKKDYEDGGAAIFTYAQGASDAAKEQANSAQQARNMSKALHATGVDADQASSSIDKVASSSKMAGFAFGDAAKAFYKSSLTQSAGFQRLMNPQTEFAANEFSNFFGQGLTLEELGLDPTTLDWEGFMEDSLKGGVDTDKLMKQLAKDLDISEFGAMQPDGSRVVTPEWTALRSFVNSIGDEFGDLSGDVEAAARATEVFGVDTINALRGVADGTADVTAAMQELPEETQKAIDSMAQGFAKFANTGSLISLTQKMNEIFSQEDVDAETKAKQWESAWSDAYGGAAFKLNDYMKVFQRAADEQTNFTKNLQNLQGRGLSHDIIADLAAMGPEAISLVEALVNGTQEELDRFSDLWGQTGYESMIQMATEMELAKTVVTNVLASTGEEGLRKFNAKLASGVGVDAALRALQLDLNGHPLRPVVSPATIPNISYAAKRAWENRNRLNLTAVLSIRGGSGMKIGNKYITPGWASGGWTGPGSKYEEKGTVHADEFVFTKRATNAIGVGNLYAMMRQAEGGTRAPRGRGYADGGLVGGGVSVSGGPNVVYLSPEDRALLRSIQPIVRIGNRDIAQANADANFVNKRQGVG